MIVVIAALAISHYSITVNIHHICKKRLSWTFSGHFVLLLLCWLCYCNVRVSFSVMAVLVILAFVNYFTFVNNVLSVMRETLHIDVFGTKFKEE